MSDSEKGTAARVAGSSRGTGTGTVEATRHETYRSTEDVSRGEQALGWARLFCAEAMAALKSVPEVMGSYHVVRELGRGGMGVVVLAEQSLPHRQVALKLLSPRVISESLQRRFELEVEVLGRLDHPGIARIYEAGTATLGGEARPYFAMEYVRGTRLDTYLKAVELDLDQRLDLFLAVCDAVSHAHLKGVIHRDLKPANILIDAEGRPKVIDFGVARAHDEQGAATRRLTETGNIVGTLSYMAPEQAAGDVDAVDIRTDVYGLGAVLYEILCQRPPRDMSSTPPALVMRDIATRDAPPPSSVDAAIPAPLDWIVLKALAKERDRRYASAKELATDVQRFRESRPLEARPVGPLYRTVLFARRHRGLVCAAGVVAMALLLGVCGLGYGWREAERQGRETKLLADYLVGVVGGSLGGGPQAVRRAIDSELRALEDSPRMRARILLLTAEGSEKAGDYEEAADYVERALELREGLFGAMSVEALEARRELGRLYGFLGRFEEGSDLLGRAALGLERELGPDDGDAILAWISKARLLVDHGSELGDRESLTEAEALLSTHVERARVLLGEDHPVSLVAVGASGWAHIGAAMLSGKSVDARAQATIDTIATALATARRVLGEDHMIALDLEFCLAMVHYYRHSSWIRAEVEGLLASSLTNYERVLGRHPLTARGALRLGILYGAMGRLDQARSQLEKAYRISAATVGERHRQTLRIRLELGRVSLRVDDFAGAADWLDDAFEASLGASDGDHLTEEIARLLDEALLRQRHCDWVEIEGYGHGGTLAALDDLLEHYRTHGVAVRAEQILLESLAADGLGPELVLAYGHRVARSLEDRGDLEAAVGTLERIVHKSREILGPNHADAVRYAEALRRLRATLADTT